LGKLPVEPVAVPVERASSSVERVTGSVEPALGSTERVSDSVEPVTGSTERVSGSVEPAAGSMERASGSVGREKHSVHFYRVKTGFPVLRQTANGKRHRRACRPVNR
jgi:hypothetical protein